MTDQDYQELEARIEMREKLKKWKEDFEKDKKERHSNSSGEPVKLNLRGEAAYSAYRTSGDSHTSGSAFERLQVSLS